MEFTDHYSIIGNLRDTLAEALKAANQEHDRVWFVRHGDSIDDEESNDADDAWEVEINRSQYVNCVGFFVTVEACRTGHDSIVFTY